MNINRRNFLIKSSLVFLSSNSVISANISTNSKPHVVIIGGGWGGLSTAKTLRKLNKKVKITIIEKNNNFISCPMSNWVIGQIKTMDDISFSYKSFSSKYNINILKEKVTNIDLDKKQIYIKNDKLSYDKLVLSTGIEKDYSSIEGWKNDSNLFPSAWEAGYETSHLANKIKNLSNGKNFVITIPLSPYRCPPGPYERISLVADFFKKNKPKSKIIVLDANQKIVSKGSLFKKAWDELYPNIIDYRPDNNIIGVNHKEKLIYTDFDDISFNVANIIPPQKAPMLIKNAGLIPNEKQWAPVNAYDFKSIINDDVFIIGDSSDQSSIGKIPKSGYIAYSMGKVCGYAIHSEIINKTPPSPSMINTCYSLVNRTEGISVTAVYKYDQNIKKIIAIENAKGLSPKRSDIIAKNAWDWAQSIWSDMLG